MIDYKFSDVKLLLGGEEIKGVSEFSYAPPSTDPKLTAAKILEELFKAAEATPAMLYPTTSPLEWIKELEALPPPIRSHMATGFFRDGWHWFVNRPALKGIRAEFFYLDDPMGKPPAPRIKRGRGGRRKRKQRR